MTAETPDVLVIGAGVSGLRAAWHLQTRCPDRRFAVLEARQTLGGTWTLRKQRHGRLVSPGCVG